MKKATLGTLVTLAMAITTSAQEPPRQRVLLDERWRFHLGDVADTDEATVPDEEPAADDEAWLKNENPDIPRAAGRATFDDSSWRELDLPHDWSIELPVTQEDPIQRGIEAFREGLEGFFENGVGWYRKSLSVEPSWIGNRVTLEFEGVYRDAEVFVNGQKAGEHPWGYTPFTVDLTPYVEGLSVGDLVVIAVRVDNQQSRFTASGIYRHVWLNVFGQTHIMGNGLYPVTTELSKEEATLHVEASIGTFVRNVRGYQKVSVEFGVFELDREGRPSSAGPVASGQASGTLVSAETRLFSEIKVPTPRMWSPDSPSLYRVVGKLYNEAGVLIDEYSVVTGIRTLAWSADRGLELNGESIKLNGGNIRHDVGILGGAAFDRAEERKVELLKEAGFNALRTAHNPFSTAFFEACDRLGMLVMDEIFYAWVREKQPAETYHKLWDQWHKHDIEAWVRRDRHHPSVIFWSIGNEIPEAGSPEGVAIARELAGLVRALDGSRLVTMGQDTPWAGGGWQSLDHIFPVLDVAGYNYALVQRNPQTQLPWLKHSFKVYDGPPRYLVDRERAPERIMFASESFQFQAFTNWKATQHKPYVLGDFVWTAMDNLDNGLLGVPYPRGVNIEEHWKGGEEYANKPWYWRGSYCGDIDLIGWRKPASYYREIIWNGDREEKDDGPVRKLYAAVQIPPAEPFESPEGDSPSESEQATDAEVKIASEAALSNSWNYDSWVTIWSIPPALPTWTWPEREGEALTVEVYSRHEAVRLYLNGKIIGEQLTGEAEEFKASFSVPYVPGVLVAVGLQGGREVERFELKTAGAPVQLRAVADRQVGYADGQDIIFVEIEACDETGEWHPWGTKNSELPWAGDTIEVQVEGAGTLIGLGTANLVGSIPYPDPRCTLFQGRALAAIRTGREPGPITVRVSSSEGLAGVELQLETRTR